MLSSHWRIMLTLLIIIRCSSSAGNENIENPKEKLDEEAQNQKEAQAATRIQRAFRKKWRNRPSQEPTEEEKKSIAAMDALKLELQRSGPAILKALHYENGSLENLENKPKIAKEYLSDEKIREISDPKIRGLAGAAKLLFYFKHRANHAIIKKAVYGPLCIYDDLKNRPSSPILFEAEDTKKLKRFVYRFSRIYNKWYKGTSSEFKDEKINMIADNNEIKKLKDNINKHKKKFQHFSRDFRPFTVEAYKKLLIDGKNPLCGINDMMIFFKLYLRFLHAFTKTKKSPSRKNLLIKLANDIMKWNDSFERLLHRLAFMRLWSELAEEFSFYSGLNEQNPTVLILYQRLLVYYVKYIAHATQTTEHLMVSFQNLYDKLIKHVDSLEYLANAPAQPFPKIDFAGTGRVFAALGMILGLFLFG